MMEPVPEEASYDIPDMFLERLEQKICKGTENQISIQVIHGIASI